MECRLTFGSMHVQWYEWHKSYRPHFFVGYAASEAVVYPIMQRGLHRNKPIEFLYAYYVYANLKIRTFHWTNDRSHWCSLKEGSTVAESTQG